MPKPGDVLLIDETASVQFHGDRSLVFRVIRVDPRPTYEGWIWLWGYTLDDRQQAIDQRNIFVQLAGLKTLAGHQARMIVQREPAQHRDPAWRRPT